MKESRIHYHFNELVTSSAKHSLTNWTSSVYKRRNCCAEGLNYGEYYNKVPLSLLLPMHDYLMHKITWLLKFLSFTKSTSSNGLLIAKNLNLLLITILVACKSHVLPPENANGTVDQKYWFRQPLRILQTVIRQPDAENYNTDSLLSYMKKVPLARI